METILTICKEFRYLENGIIRIGFGRFVDATSAEHPAGMVDKTRRTPAGLYPVIPCGSILT